MNESVPPEPSDELLVVRCQLGSRDDWEVLVRRWHPRLHRFVQKMLVDEQAAEDVLQNVWLRVVRSLIRIESPDRFSAWLFSLTRRAVVDRLRAKYRHDAQEELEDLPDWNETEPEQPIAMREEIDAALDRLQPVEREAVVLFYLEDLSINEVAEICAVSPGTIKSRLHRARQIMRKTLDP